MVLEENGLHGKITLKSEFIKNLFKLQIISIHICKLN